MEFSVLTLLFSTLFFGLLGLALAKPTETYKYFQRKRYQYDVTLALYMLTPKEKFVFNSVLFLTLTLLLIAACLYLPEHIAIIASRVYYYCFGDNELGARLSSIMGSASGKGNVTVEAVQSVLRKSSGEAAREMLGAN